MVINPLPISRAELARFLPNHSAIRAFEELFRVAGELTPAQIAELRVLIQEKVLARRPRRQTAIWRALPMRLNCWRRRRALRWCKAIAWQI
jgi:hypothetical protein